MTSISLEKNVKNQIFIDTVFMLATMNRRDQYHEQAARLAKRYEGYQLLITDAVLLEVGNTLARHHKQEAVEAIQYALASPEIEVVHLTPELFEKGFALYRGYKDKVWGLVDCISFVVMREAGVTAALTFDRHFEQAGFQVLMREDSN